MADSPLIPKYFSRMETVFSKVFENILTDPSPPLIFNSNYI